jgi:hypothetical protein
MMGILFDTIGDLCAQMGVGALSSVETLAQITTFDDSINAVSCFKERL